MPVTVMPGTSGRGFVSSPQGRTQENDASFTMLGDITFVQLVLKCMLLVGDGAVNAGYTLGSPKPTFSVVVRLNDPYKRSRPSLKLWSTRAVH
jgi:hypothetical protein